MIPVGLRARQKASGMTFHETISNLNGRGPHLCVGIDPSSKTLGAWGLEDTPDGLRAFGTAMVAAASGLAPVVKPQVAYFERHGPAGMQALSEVIATAREQGLLVIADAKRGDIGSTCEAYAQAWLGDGAPMQADALTATAYLGLRALDPILNRAADCGACCFVVLRSSNPEGTPLQIHGSAAGGQPMWHRLMEDIRQRDAELGDGVIGAVVGATQPDDLRTALEQLPNSLILAPGIGAQGATPEDIAGLGDAANRVLMSASRSLSNAGPDVDSVRAAIRETMTL